MPETRPSVVPSICVGISGSPNHETVQGHERVAVAFGRVACAPGVIAPLHGAACADPTIQTPTKNGSDELQYH
jgi:hypothetical protein